MPAWKRDCDRWQKVWRRYRDKFRMKTTPLLGLLSGLLFAADASSLKAASATLLGWNNLGMHCMDSSYSEFSILPPYNTIEAQLIVNGKLIKSGTGYTVTYEAVRDPDGSINSTSVGKGNWMPNAPMIYGVPSNWSADQGLAGWNMPGIHNTPQRMLFEQRNAPAPGASTLVNWFRAEGIPITPYDDSGQKNPYPLMRLVARNLANQVVAQSDVVLPVSDEMDCRACHGARTQEAARPFNGWLTDPNPDREYRLNILKRHDDREMDPATGHAALYSEALEARGYDPAGLYASAIAGKPALCAGCHASEALGTGSFASSRGNGSVPPLTTSIHSLHAEVMDPAFKLPLNSSENRAACYLCHPGSATRCLRGAMGNAVAPDGTMSMQCQSCHGNMKQVGSSARVGWFMEPKCQSCHTGTATRNNGQIRYNSVFDAENHERVAVDSTFATTPDSPAAGISLYRFSVGHGGLQCSACHGSTHAEFPASHRNDNLRNVQIQGHAGVTVECMACHTTLPKTIDGGPHGMHPIGQAWVNDHHDAVSQVGLAACQKCHGSDNRGTVLSRVQGDRRFSMEGAGNLTLFRGATVGCYTCHQGPSSDSMNATSAPAITNVIATTVGGQPVNLVLPKGSPSTELRVISQPQNGSIGIRENVATYYPFDGFTGTDTFTFAGYDGAKNTSLATGTLLVNPASPDAIAPVIESQPSHQLAIPGSTASFSVKASGGTLRYRWFLNGWEIPNAAESTLVLENVTSSWEGEYVVLVGNQHTEVASSPARLSVITPVAITSQPVGRTVNAGATFTLSVSANGSAPLTYQWTRDGSIINGATSPSIRLSQVKVTSAGTYRVAVSNPAGTVWSEPAILVVLAPPTITSQPVSQTVSAGSPVSLTIAASGFPAPSFQWYRGGVTIPAATNAVLTLLSVSPTDAGSYHATASNQLGLATSATATLTVLQPPSLSSVAPSTGSPGTKVILRGTGLTSTTSVLFNGTPAQFGILSSTQISATVPSGAGSGPVTVVTPDGNLVSTSPFIVTPKKRPESYASQSSED